jgi:hypothetical protein
MARKPSGENVHNLAFSALRVLEWEKFELPQEE